MINIELFIFIPMPENEWMTNNEIYRIRLYDMIDQLCELDNKIPYSYDGIGISNINIELLDEKQRNSETKLINLGYDSSIYEIMKLA